jgi:dihydropteroate synthase
LEAKDTVFYSKKTLNFNGRLIDLSKPLVMGILNVTPDSFFDGGIHNTEKAILDKTFQMLNEGASIIDIGGYSSRPGAENISKGEELKRVIPAVKSIIKNFPKACLSIDTFRADVAREAVNEGVSIINDISGGALDANMYAVVKEFQTPYILMHMRGNPATMHKETSYENIHLEMTDYFQKKIHLLHEMGIKDIVLDPGFGFAKNIEQNFNLLKDLGYFKSLSLPIIAGISRKSMIYKTLQRGPEDALNGTTVLNTIALMNGADILRVHDVKEAVEAVELYCKTYPNKGIW